MKLNPNELGTQILGTGWSVCPKTQDKSTGFIYRRSIEDLSDFSKTAQAKTLKAMGIQTCIKQLSSGQPYWEVSDTESTANLENVLTKCQVVLPLHKLYLQKSR